MTILSLIASYDFPGILELNNKIKRRRFKVFIMQLKVNGTLQ